jgi:predicted  nucleic acid-binding Zn-ribbon protein
MPKKKNKKDKQDAAASDPIEAVRAAIERTFHATSEGAAGTQKRTRQLVDEVTHAAARIRETIEELRVLDEVKGLRNEIEALGRRIAALEARDSTPKPASSTASRARTTRTAPARSKSTGTTRAKSTGTTRAKPAAAKKPAAARKPRATRSTAGTRTRSTRTSSNSS